MIKLTIRKGGNNDKESLSNDIKPQKGDEWIDPETGDKVYVQKKPGRKAGAKKKSEEETQRLHSNPQADNGHDGAGQDPVRKEGTSSSSKTI